MLVQKNITDRNVKQLHVLVAFFPTDISYLSKATFTLGTPHMQLLNRISRIWHPEALKKQLGINVQGYINVWKKNIYTI